MDQCCEQGVFRNCGVKTPLMFFVGAWRVHSDAFGQVGKLLTAFPHKGSHGLLFPNASWASLAIHIVGTGSRLSPGYLGEDWWLYGHMFRRPYLLLLPAFTPASSLLYRENHSLVSLN